MASGMNMNVTHHQPVFSETSLLQQRGSVASKEPPKRVLHLEKGRRNFLKDPSRRKKNSFPRTSLPPVSEEGISNARSPQYATVGPQKVTVKVKLVNPQVIHLREEGGGAKQSRFQGLETAEVLLNHQPEDSPRDDVTNMRTITHNIQQKVNKAPPTRFNQHYNNNNDDDYYQSENEDIGKSVSPNISLRSRSFSSASSNSKLFTADTPRPTVANGHCKALLSDGEHRPNHGNGSQKAGNMYSKLTGNLDPQYKTTANHFKMNFSNNNNVVESPCQNRSYNDTLRMLQNGTKTLVETFSIPKTDTSTATAASFQNKETDYSSDPAVVGSNAQDKGFQQADRRRDDLNVPVCSPSTMSSRQAWEEIQKRKAKMREDFFRMPTETLDRDVAAGRLRGRRSKSEPRLNALKSEINKNQSILRENSKRDSAPIWSTPRVSSPDLTKQPSLTNERPNNNNVTSSLRPSAWSFEKRWEKENSPKPLPLYLTEKTSAVNQNYPSFLGESNRNNNNINHEQYNSADSSVNSNLFETETVLNVDSFRHNQRYPVEPTTHSKVARPTPPPEPTTHSKWTRPTPPPEPTTHSKVICPTPALEPTTHSKGTRPTPPQEPTTHSKVIRPTPPPEPTTHSKGARPTPAPRRSRSVAAARPQSLQQSNGNSNTVDSNKHGFTNNRNSSTVESLNHGPYNASSSVDSMKRTSNNNQNSNTIESMNSSTYNNQVSNTVQSVTHTPYNTTSSTVDSMQHVSNNNQNSSTVEPLKLGSYSISNKVDPINQGCYMSRGQTADIHLARDPDLVHQRVCLVTHVSQVSPNVTVTRYRVPAIPYRDKWEWVQKYGQNNLLSGQNNLLSGQNNLLSGQNNLLSGQNNLLSGQNNMYGSKHSQTAAEGGNSRHHNTLRDTSCPTSPVSPSSVVSSPDDSSYSASNFTLNEKAVRSPTPSSGYNSCSNACSPSPIPSPDSCYTHPMMSDASSIHYVTRPHHSYRTGCSSPGVATEQYSSTPSASRKSRGDSFSSDYLPSSALDNSDWSEMTCRRKPSDQDSSSSSSSSGCYSGASSPTPLAPPLAPHSGDHRPMPSAL